MDTTAIWNAFHREIHHYILRQVHDEDLAKDILQEVFMKIHLKLHTLYDADKLPSWVYSITRNCIADQMKGLKKQKINPDQIENEEAERHEFEKCLLPFVNRLPAKYRDALIQTELGQLSQKEFATKLNISYSTAKSRVQRAKLQLHALFLACCQPVADSYGNIIHRNKAKCSCACQD